MVDRKPSPKLLVTWAIAGAVLATSPWLLSFVHIPRLSVNGSGFWAVLWMNRLRFVAYFAPFAIGIAISLWAEQQLKRGFQDEIWSEAELESVRTLITKPVWSWASWLLIGAAVVSVIFSARTAHTDGNFFYTLIFPILTATRIRQLVTPKIESTIGLNLQ
jgi:hypothetical protein